MNGGTHGNQLGEAIRLLVPDGKITLVAIPADGGTPEPKTFLVPEQIDEAADWALSRNRRTQNIYWQVNDSDQLHARIKAEEVTTARYFWADIDPKCKEFGSYEDARDDLLNRVLPKVAELATFVVDSGNGLQALFRLPEPLPLNGEGALEAYTLLNKRLGVEFEGPGTHNADRILRLPGTLNYPNPAKRKKGYPEAPRLSRIIAQTGRTWTTSELNSLLSTSAPALASVKPAPLLLPVIDSAELASRFEQFLLNNTTARHRFNGGTDGLTDHSGSARDMSMVAMMRPAGFSKGEIRSLLSNWPHGSVGGRQQDDRYWDRMWDKAGEPRAPASVPLQAAPQPQLEQQASVPHQYQLFTASDLMSLPASTWVVKGLLPQRGLASIYGPSNCGKSFLAVDMGLHIALGERWYDKGATGSPVIYIALEGSSGVRQRLQAWESHHGKQIPTTFRIVFEHLSLYQDGDVEALSEVVHKAGLTGGVVIVDTLNQSAPEADENTSKDMGRIITRAKRLQELTDSLVILIHHAGKDVAKGLRGHTSLLAALDVAIEVKNDSTGRGWTLTKSKDAATGASGAFKLEPVNLGTDPDGDPVTSAVVVPDTQAALTSLQRKPRGSHQIIALREIRHQLNLLSTQSVFGTPKVPLETMVNVISGKLAVEPKRCKERARSAITGLIAGGFIEQQGLDICLA